MSKIRALIVDDAVVVRMIVSKVIADDPALEVAAIAPSGAIAFEKIVQVNPDIVIMDVEMPGMDGLETLRKIKTSYPKIPIIMFTSNTQRSADLAVQALTLGASDFILKPSNMKNQDDAISYLRENLLPKIKVVCEKIARPLQIPKPAGAALIEKTAIATSKDAIDVVVIGISTGGPNALADFLPKIASGFPSPILIVQHMPPVFTKLLADRLSAASKIPFSEGKPGEVVTPGRGWIAPGDYHMIVYRDGADVKLGLHQGPPENSCRPAVDVLFRSVAEVYRNRALAVVMTGMGKDGLRGCERIREAGGQIFVQDEASSVVWSMPGSVYGAGLADKVIPLKDMAIELERKVKASYERVR